MCNANHLNVYDVTLMLEVLAYHSIHRIQMRVRENFIEDLIV
jgi:hypothetical protein